MNIQQLACIERKNAWLYNLVEVEFPTQESLKGRDIYFNTLNGQAYHSVDKSSLLSELSVFSENDIFLVDFHRLTIMFSILQSNRWEQQSDKDMIIEYLTQIILTPEFELYVVFAEGNPIGAAVASHFEGNTLISDLAVVPEVNQQDIVVSLAHKLSSEGKLLETVILES
ncbi:flavodoxin [Vibrio mytili]|uniref:flavodoxin n=1 Tax=Vibrio mytili TaxID=50718 RepID=UPI002F42A10F